MNGDQHISVTINGKKRDCACTVDKQDFDDTGKPRIQGAVYLPTTPVVIGKSLEATLGVNIWNMTITSRNIVTRDGHELGWVYGFSAIWEGKRTPATPTFHPGSLVSLRSGGSSMTVTEVVPGSTVSESLVRCVWHTENGTPASADYPGAVLEAR